ncbi:ferredoxin [Streptomyces sp. NPDC002454]
MRIETDEDRCCGGGQCVLVAPELFDQRDTDGVVVLLTPAPHPRHHAEAREAALLCPGGAITVHTS